MKKPAPEKFASEAEMCAKFIAAIGPLWTAYAETGGWDILLSRKSDGLQVGIQAKLLMNAHVVSQCLDERYQWGLTGPDHRAILVPSYATPFSEKICQTIGITIITVQKGEKKYYQRNVFRPLLPVEDIHQISNSDWHEWCPEKRVELPEYVPDVAAGSPAPVQLTRWKISAIKIAVLLEKRGFVTRSDFKHVGIDVRRWTDGLWLIAGDKGLIAGPHFPTLRAQHPRVFDEVAADFDKWAPVMREAPARIGALI